MQQRSLELGSFGAEFLPASHLASQHGCVNAQEVRGGSGTVMFLEHLSLHRALFWPLYPYPLIHSSSLRICNDMLHTSFMHEDPEIRDAEWLAHSCSACSRAVTRTPGVFSPCLWSWPSQPAVSNELAWGKSHGSCLVIEFAQQAHFHKMDRFLRGWGSWMVETVKGDSSNTAGSNRVYDLREPWIPLVLSQVNNSLSKDLLSTYYMWAWF